MGRPKGSKNAPKGTSELPGQENILRPQDATSEVAVTSTTRKRRSGPQKAKEVAKKAIPEAPDTAAAATPVVDAPAQRDLVVMDVQTGEIVGRDKSLNLDVSARAYYSHSFLRGYASCSARTYFRTIKAPARKSFALERGSCAHELIERFAKEGRDPVANFPEAWERFITANLPEMSEADQEKAPREYEVTKLMLEEFVIENNELFQKRVRPEDAEVEFNVPVVMTVGNKQFTRNFFGKIDLILWNSDRTRYRIIDYKTSASSPGDEALSLDTQFALYQYAATQKLGLPPSAMDFYLLKGQHVCDERFSSAKHPRDPLRRLPNCQVNYALKVPIKTDEEIQDLFNLYYANLILKYEAGFFSRDGRSDPKNQCGRCEYLQHCLQTRSFPTPVII